LVRAAFLGRTLLQAGSRNQTSNAAHDWSAIGCFSVASLIVGRECAKAVATIGANAMAQTTNAADVMAAEIILLNMTFPSGASYLEDGDIDLIPSV
jgi:hypothetical protein